MKIIKNGLAENKPATIHCVHGCKSVLQVEPKDIKRKSHDQRDGSAYIFECAVCKKDIWVDMSTIGWNGV